MACTSTNGLVLIPGTSTSLSCMESRWWGKPLLLCVLPGCKETHIASRYTLAFVNSWLTKSTLPFIWDDPTTAEDVSQVAIFQMGPGNKGGTFNKEKRPGDAKVLGDHSSWHQLHSHNAECPVNHHCGAGAPGNSDHADQISSSKPEETGGDSIPSITNLVDRGDLFNEVTDYLKSVVIPYYQRNISKLAATSSVTIQGESAEAHLPEPDRVLNVEPVLLSLPPTSLTPICTPPSSPSLPSPQFEAEFPAPPSLPSTPPQLSLEEEVLDDSFVLPPPSTYLDATLQCHHQKVLSKPIPVQQIANLMSATPASPGTEEAPAEIEMLTVEGFTLQEEDDILVCTDESGDIKNFLCARYLVEALFILDEEEYITISMSNILPAYVRAEIVPGTSEGNRINNISLV
ncbi:unnamed protein product [Mytilus edulis]|uniref:Uncharacterized protein n=1 Tax=Mytilus edulis TaxID=6550 RepID=A0A8S3RL65_MYTED|nr:unnamed protein product [Mytilus edulis]